MYVCVRITLHPPNDRMTWPIDQYTSKNWLSLVESFTPSLRQSFIEPYWVSVRGPCLWFGLPGASKKLGRLCAKVSVRACSRRASRTTSDHFFLFPLGRCPWTRGPSLAEKDVWVEFIPSSVCPCVENCAFEFSTWFDILNDLHICILYHSFS